MALSLMFVFCFKFVANPNSELILVQDTNISPLLLTIIFANVFFSDLATFYIQAALARYKKMRGNAPERLVSGSDDFTMFLWEPAISKQPKARMTGHQKVQYLILLAP